MKSHVKQDQEPIAELATLAKRVRTKHDDLNRAFDAERRAEAALLDAAIQAIKPALPALASQIVCGSNNNETQFLEVKGLLIAGGLDDPGEALYLRDNGELLHLCYESSTIDGSIVVTSRTFKPTIETVCQNFCVGALLENIRLSLLSQDRGAMTKRTAQSKERTAKLEALVTLLNR